MYLVHIIRQAVLAGLEELYGQSFEEKDFQINETIDSFEGDYTVVLFALLKKTKAKLPELGAKLGDKLITSHPDLVESYNVEKGFLNLVISDHYCISLLKDITLNPEFGTQPSTGKIVMVEYSSPNTNKPLHLGHLRNNFLGWSIAEILKATGNTVYKSSIVNDRGIHICKSMYAWKYFGNGETPSTASCKGDHLVGKYYVMFEKELRKQTADLEELENSGTYEHYPETQLQKVQALEAIISTASDDKSSAEKKEKAKADLNEIRRAATPIMKEVTEMLQKWEAGDDETLALWSLLNGWVYEGMAKTYEAIGVDFDKTYYESNTYLLGKNIVAEGLEKNIFHKKPDTSVWIDLTDDGLDEKLVLRKDGTSVYITQDIGLARQKYEEYKIDRSIYVIGDEQNYHMKVLQLICKKLGLSYADDIYHLSYGMVELPEGKMKSREGTVVDADDMVETMINEAISKTAELGKVDEFSPEDLDRLNENIGLGALKFFLLRIDPKKRMIFNPAESIDFHGFTAPYIQFNHARICSILKKNSDSPITPHKLTKIEKSEKSLVLLLEKYPAIVQQAADELNPSVVAGYAYSVAKAFSSFYTEHSINKAENEAIKNWRLSIAAVTADVLRKSMGLLGINTPQKM